MVGFFYSPPTMTPQVGIELLQDALERARDLDVDLAADEEAFDAWKAEVEVLIIGALGNGAEVVAFRHERSRDGSWLVGADAQEKQAAYRETLDRLGRLLVAYLRILKAKVKSTTTSAARSRGDMLFIGHGRSHAWRDLRDFLKDRLHLSVDEFNRVPVAGATTIERLQEMLNSACLAFLVMTAEDEVAEGVVQARQNVVHEVGLFQGRLGFRRAIVLLEEGCQEFSNITGLSQIRFPKDNIKAVFEEVRRVLEREGLIPGDGTAF